MKSSYTLNDFVKKQTKNEENKIICKKIYGIEHDGL